MEETLTELAQPSLSESQEPTSGEVLHISIPPGTKLEIQFSTSTSTRNNTSTASSDIGTALSTLTLLKEKVDRLPTKSISEAAMDGDYSRSPVEAAVMLTLATIKELLKGEIDALESSEVRNDS